MSGAREWGAHRGVCGTRPVSPSGTLGENPSLTLSAGTSVGPYEVLAPLGAGGMGVVYRARDTRLLREVALKVLPEAVVSEPERLRRFQVEARAASALNHPNVVTIYDVGEHAGAPYIAMELVEGRPLRALLGEPLPMPELLSIGAQIAAGLSRAHDAGIVHRDLKPENVVVTADGAVKILDFGLAKYVAPGPADSLVDTLARATASGVILGTVGYMSPEQATGAPADFRSDQFAFGAILFEMATGRAPFRKATAVETLSAILREPAPSLARLRPDAPAPMAALVERCLSKQAEDRFPSSRDLAAELGRLRESTQPSATVLVGAVRSRRAAALWLAAGLIALLAAGAVLWRRSTARPTGGASSLAVLPFQNLGGKAEDEYFVDGMTDALITDLAQVKDLLVIARNSVFVYKGKAVDARQAGRELNVRYLLEGSVQRSGDTVRVNAQLVDASSGFQLWAEKYDKPVRELFALQDDIAGRISQALRLALRPTPPAGGSLPQANGEAYDQYLRGMFHANQRPWPEKDKAIPYLERAIQIDPRFARAHAVLARQYARKSFEADPQRAWEQKGFVEVEKALALDATLAEAYMARSSLAWTLANGFPHERAASDLTKAVSLDPSNAGARDELASLYMHLGFLEEALAGFAEALRIDPRDDFAPYRVARIRLYQGHYDEALAAFRACRPGDFQIPLTLAHLGRHEEALRQSDRAVSDMDAHAASSDASGSRAVLLALGHRPGESEAAIEAARKGEGSSHFHHTAYNIATACALLGKTAEAVRWLERTATEGMPCLPLFERDPFLDAIRSDAAFQDFLRRTRSEHERLRRALLPAS